MKCIPLVWPGEPEPVPTFVLHKREVAVLLDVPNKNPRSQWLAATFEKWRLYTCDGHRFVCCEAKGAVLGEFDENYIPLAMVKEAAKTLKMTTALLVSKFGAGYRVAALETENKTWNLFRDYVLTEHGELKYTALIPHAEAGDAVARIPLMVSVVDQLLAFAESDEPVVRKVDFKPGWLATFGMLDRLVKPNSVTMHLGPGNLDASMFQVEDTPGETKWQYVLMPMRPKYG